MQKFTHGDTTIYIPARGEQAPRGAIRLRIVPRSRADEVTTLEREIVELEAARQRAKEQRIINQVDRINATIAMKRNLLERARQRASNEIAAQTLAKLRTKS